MSSSKNGTASAGPEKRRPRATSTTTTTTDPSPASTPPPAGQGRNPRRSDASPAPPPSLIRDMPPEKRPRQRLLRGGGHALSDAEVLSVVLGGGSRGVCPLGLARDLLANRGGLFGLVGARPEALRRQGEPLTATAAQEELRAVAHQLLDADDRLRAVLEALPRSPDEDAMFEGRIPLDLPTELRAVVECVAEEHVRPAVHALERASRVSEDELHRDFPRGRR